MIFPLTTNPNDVNTAMIRISGENNADIENMKKQIDLMRAQQMEMEDRFQSQITRWNDYNNAYQDTLNAFQISNGNVNIDRMKELLPWSQL